MNSALFGAGVAASAGIVTLAEVDIATNIATNDGGGIALWSTASLVLSASQVRGNQALRNGGGVYTRSNGTFSADSTSTISNCTAGKMFFDYLVKIRVMVPITNTSDGASLQLLVEASMGMTDNQAVESGGGVYAIDAVISGSLTVRGNTAAQGGGVATSGTTTLEGFVVDANTATNGGGLASESSSLTLRNVEVGSCSASQGHGGGLYFSNADVIHRDLSVRNCTSLRGGGAYVESTSFRRYPSEESSAFTTSVAVLTECHAEEFGGGVFIAGEHSNVSDFAVFDGDAPFGGGLATLETHACEIYNAEIQNSTATQSGGGAFFGLDADCVFRDSWVARNGANESGGGVMVQDAMLTHSNLTIFANVAPTGAGAHVQSSLQEASVLMWEDQEAMRSQIHANIIDPEGGNGGNVLLESAVECAMSGTDISDGNVTTGQGGGVFISGRGSINLSYALVANNYAEKGGGIAVGGAQTSELDNVALVGNTASTGGGGLWAESLEFYPELTMTSCVFYNNSAETFGGAIALLAVDLTTSELLVVENYVTDPTAGLGGGIHTQQGASITADTWLLLLNDAVIGGAIAGTKASEISLLNANITRDPELFTDFWQAFFHDLVGSNYVAGLVQGKPDLTVQRGGLIFLTDQSTILELLSSLLTHGTANAGGGVYTDSNAFLYAEDSEFSKNAANQQGGSLCVSSTSEIYFVSVKNYGGGLFVETSSKAYLENSEVSDNVADDSGGGIFLDTGDDISVILNQTTVQRNLANGQGCGAAFTQRKGGAISAVDGTVEVGNCTFANNTALVGGAIRVDRNGHVTLNSSLFSSNTADQRGGAIATEVKAKVTITGLSSFEDNEAPSGGAVAAIGQSSITLVTASFSRNQAKTEGGALYSTGQATLNLTASVFESNNAELGGAVRVDEDSAVDILDCQFLSNVASSRGGAMYYQTIDSTIMTAIICKGNRAPSGGCVFWISNDEDLTPVYPCDSCTMEGNDLYDIATNTREVQIMWWPANVSSGVTALEPPDEESIELLEPLNASLEATTFVWPRLKVVDLYGQIEVLDSQTECTVGGGQSSNQTGTILDGMRCFDCPAGAKCNETVRRATETIGTELGTASPRTEGGFYLFSAPASKQHSSCQNPKQWKDLDPCKALALADPTADLAAVIYACSILNDFNVYWPADRLFSCLSGESFYTCDTEALTALKLRIMNRFRRGHAKPTKSLFGVDVSPPPWSFPVKPSKLKIIIGFFQIFGNFQNAFVVKWASNVQTLMNFSQKFNLVRFCEASIAVVLVPSGTDSPLKPLNLPIHCPGLGGYRWNRLCDHENLLLRLRVSAPVSPSSIFRMLTIDSLGMSCCSVTIGLVVIVLVVITAYFFAGLRSYRAKLQLIPRNCLRCGLPVLESEAIRNDDESFNPLLLVRSWWRTRRFYRRNRSPSADASEDGSPRQQPDSPPTISILPETRRLKREFGMSQVRTPYLGLFRSVHAECPVKRHVLSGAMLERTIRGNLRVWQARVKLRMNYLTYRNKCLKLYCWMALFFYPSVSKTILTIFNCQEVGDVYYLVVDRRIVCYNGEWALFGILATGGIVIWVVGIPFFFGLLIWLAQDRGVAARLKLLRKPQLRAHRQKWLKEVEEQHAADGRFVRDMDSVDVQDEELARYMKRKNLTVRDCLGATQSFGLLALELIRIALHRRIPPCKRAWASSTPNPYDDHSDNLIASIAQLQLFFTLWLGVMIRLNDLNAESLINEQLLSFLLVGTCVAVTVFGLSMVIGDGVEGARRMSAEIQADRKYRVQQEVWKRWNKAFNYAAYEAQMLRFGGQLSFAHFSVPAMLEAFRRTKDLDHNPETFSAMPQIDEQEEELSSTDVQLPDLRERGNASNRRDPQRFDGMQEH
ncbi:hypothetical protein BBJ28_00002549 [Nothophytophthora sp. Chile5]|nr:hypothetical protein BBJ28_00002549 [Nothophytophthora sp. Chile5]